MILDLKEKHDTSLDFIYFVKASGCFIWLNVLLRH